MPKTRLFKFETTETVKRIYHVKAFNIDHARVRFDDGKITTFIHDEVTDVDIIDVKEIEF